MTDKKPVTYKDAGVDIDAGEQTVKLIKKHVHSTHSPLVLAGVGAFGGLFDLSEIVKNYREPVLVQSIDGVGTKLMVANMANNHKGVGQDIVNHGCNDVLCQGARPVTFLDYVAMAKLSVEQMEEIVAGMAEACREAGVAILGGETAELPGMYREKEYDLAGVLTGVVEKSKIVDGRSITPGMTLVGLASNGLHTNGYTLARKVCFDVAGLTVNDTPDGWGMTIGEALLLPHVNYAGAVLSFLESERAHGLAHITGGGIKGNLARVLPENITAEVKKGSWPSLPIFDLIQREGNVPEDDMYRTFNMGVGFILVVEEAIDGKAVEFFNSAGHPAFIIGKTVAGDGTVRYV